MRKCWFWICCLGFASQGLAGVGDPQVKTDHPWYPGELACSTFDRLAETQATVYERLVGHPPESDEERVLAAWIWRNTHYAHGEQGAQNLWGGGFQDGDTTTREYWTGLFAHGFGLCGTTHAQWTAELNSLLGPGRSRTVGVVGHNSCEVFLKGGPYGNGRWALLDHDISTVVFDPSGERLLSIEEISRDLHRLTNPKFHPERQYDWPLGGLHPDDPLAFAEFNVVEHYPGYAGPPPRIHLRRGESLRRFHFPGLDDGKTYVFWGRNYRTQGIPGLERSRTWINQPERFIRSPEGSGYRPGQARYGNAVYTYRPDFNSHAYREGVIQENDEEVVFEFQTPFVIAATPPDDSDWGIYKSGCQNGLRVLGEISFPVSVSLDQGTSWQTADPVAGEIDLTDIVKGSNQYWLKFGASQKELSAAALEMITVCQANPAIFPRLRDNGTIVEFAASGTAIISAGPNRSQVQQHLIAGAFDSPKLTLQLDSPRGRPATRVFAAAHIASSNPPDPEIRYQIEYSTDQGASWSPIVKNWQIVRQGVEPQDFWSQSFCYGESALPMVTSSPVQVRFHNDGGKRYLRAEAHLAYEVEHPGNCRVTFAWSEDGKMNRVSSRVVNSAQPEHWTIDTGRNVATHWVEFACD